MRRMIFSLAVLLVCPSAYALTLVGPSTAMLDGTRMGVSVEYGQIDADITFDVDGGLTESFDIQTALAAFHFAGTERWEFFGRLGGAQAEAEGFDGDWGLAWGLGTRLTALEWNDFSWGALAQFTSLTSQFETVDEFVDRGNTIVANSKEDLNVVEYIFATGPTWRHDRFCVYGGFLLRYVEGDLDVNAGSLGFTFDFDEQWDAGGYVGGKVTLFKTEPARTSGLSRCDLVVEGQFTGDSTGFSAGLLLPFGAEY